MAGEQPTMTCSRINAGGSGVRAKLGFSGGSASGEGGGESSRSTCRQARQTRQATLEACRDSAAPWHHGETAVRRGQK